MELYINGEKAYEGMKVKTFRGEPATLLSWDAPGTRSGGSGGRVFIEEESGSRSEYFPSVIGGEFRKEASPDENAEG